MAPDLRSPFAFPHSRSVVALLLASLTIPIQAVRAQSTPAPGVPAAAPAAAAPAAKQDFSQEAVVIQQMLTKVRFEGDGTGTRETTARIKVQADAGVKQLAVLTFTYTSANQQVDIAYVRVIHPDGSVVVTPDYNVQDMPADVSREAPMYSDIHEKHVAVRGLGVGDTLEYKVTLRTLKAEDPGQFWMEYSFDKDTITLDEQLDIDVPADKQITVASADVQPTITTQNGRKLYHWASHNLSRPDPDKPKSTKHWKPSVQLTTFASWAQVGSWYDSLQNDRVQVTPAIQAKADALTKGLTNEDDKIRAIFDAVALHIHYVSLSFGIGRYQPHPADDVLANEYGDCKDKHTLLATLLKAAGIEAWPALIPSSRELDPAVPSPAQFDHVITVVPRDGKLVWMDSTAEVAPMGILFASLRDKQALVVPVGKPAYLERTAAVLPFPQSAHFETDGELSDKGVFTAHIDQKYQGDVGMFMRAMFRAVPQSQWKEFVQRLSSGMGFGGEVKTPVVSDVEKIGDPFHFSYDYTREKYGEWDDRRVGAAMPPVGWELMPGVKVIKPADDVDIGSPGEQDYISKIKVPMGARVFPPTGIDLKEDWAEYHSSYSFTEETFIAERRLVFKKEYVPLADWDKYVAFRNAIYNDAVSMATITLAGMPPGVPTTTPGGAYNAGLVQEILAKMQPLRDAALLMVSDTPPSADKLAASLQPARDAVQQIEARSLELPADQLSSVLWTEALAASWTTLGWLELQSNDLAGAEGHLRAAWTLTHSELAGYEYAQVLNAKGDKTEAARVLKFAAVAPNGGMLMSLTGGFNPHDHIAEEYKKVTGAELDATPLKNGRYEGSLREAFDKQVEVHPYIRKTSVNGTGYYAVICEEGKPVKAHLLDGDKGMEKFVSTLENSRFAVPLPAGSKGRVLREVKLICSQYAGCDAYMLSPDHIEQMPKKFSPVTSTLERSKSPKIIQLVPRPK